MKESLFSAIRAKLITLYGPEPGQAAYNRLRTTLDTFAARHPATSQTESSLHDRISERDIMLITYGDSLMEPDRRPLQTLRQFLRDTLRGTLSAVHILPFFPYSSDDGFSVIDYQAVNPALGTWNDVRALADDFHLMFDGVINHISSESEWFQGFLSGDPAYRDYFITADPAADLSAVVRPRSLPLLTPVNTPGGTQHVWTTFSADQIDLNFAHPDVLLRIVDVLLFYVTQGMRFLRLDAIAYLWKIAGTSCIHLEQTHLVVKLLRDIFDVVAPYVTIITETNVPHAENLSYFGDGTDEAQLVYQFSLPPLILHTFTASSADVLSEWAASLKTSSDRTTFFNFTASHDGIGVRPAEGILSPEDVKRLVERVRAHQGDVSFKRNSDGSESPYELNINYFDALSDPASHEPIERQVQRFIASQAIQLAFVGMPGIYIHSILGSRNWNEGVQQTGRLRSINRERLDARVVRSELANPASRRSQVFSAYTRLIAARIKEKAFHPNGPQQVVRLHPACFGLLRTSPDGREHVAALHNVSADSIRLNLEQIALSGVSHYRDLLTGARFDASTSLEAAPYQIFWLKAE